MAAVVDLVSVTESFRASYSTVSKGEKIGVEYLFSQTNKVLKDFTLDPDSEDFAEFEASAGAVSLDEDEASDEGFEDVDEVDDLTLPPVDAEQLGPDEGSSTSGMSTPTPPVITTTGDKPQESTDPGTCVGPDNIDGFEAVDRLASYLYSMRDQTKPLATNQANLIVRLWDKLSPYGKEPTVPSPRHQTRLTKRSVTTFKVRSKPSFVAGVDSTKRAFHGTEGGAAQRPDSNRYMKLLIVKLCSNYPSPVKKGGKRVDRWNLVAAAYRNIRELVINNPIVTGGC